MRFVLLIAAAGCTEHVQLGGDTLPGLVALDVSPPTDAIAFTAVGAPAQRVAYVATGHFKDGSSRDVTELVDWTTYNPFPGMFEHPGDYLASGAAAGRATSWAACSGRSPPRPRSSPPFTCTTRTCPRRRPT